MSTAGRPLRVTFRDAEAFAREFDDNLSNQGLFIPTGDRRPVRTMIDFVLVVPVSGEEIRGRGEVIYHVEPAGSGDRGQRAGLGVQVVELDMTAARRARAFVQESINEAALRPPEQRQAVRIPARLEVRYRTRAEFEAGLTRDISTGGTYLLADEPFPVGTPIQVRFVRPLDGKELVLDGVVARTPLVVAQGGHSIGIGVRFGALEAGQQDEVQRFVGYMDLRQRVGRAESLRGRVDDTGVECVVHALCSAEREGELVFRRGATAGRIEVKDRHIVRAELPSHGLSGERAFFRLLTWMDGDFEYQSRRVDAAGGMNQPGEMLLRQGLRLRETFGRWSQRIPADRRLVPGPAFAEGGTRLPASARRLLDLIEQRPTVQSVLDRLGRSDLEAYQVLARLWKDGIVRFE